MYVLGASTVRLGASEIVIIIVIIIHQKLSSFSLLLSIRNCHHYRIIIHQNQPQLLPLHAQSKNRLFPVRFLGYGVTDCDRDFWDWGWLFDC